MRIFVPLWTGHGAVYRGGAVYRELPDYHSCSGEKGGLDRDAEKPVLGLYRQSDWRGAAGGCDRVQRTIEPV